ncbi:molybdopterin molybdenumtransferase MoeA [Boudabousia liubingyangii]|uniref:Molybdopterin molybdenumtransferase n=1 Tax=Boudabousia liubingyangii TaxID=1921764 RepID=A0A1Q5PLB6_9ACTO|nr:gephyrin-like molybdotransferase Glp [Boudabousia liubingyangii]OKL47097.1 molybdopterin molybdenumtransferase MoeA [Boudabousia liubingyangii]OKL47840.1 molybdopterin molybdenumtransferase MoeA [Boudabousia liubingyangii]
MKSVAQHAKDCVSAVGILPELEVTLVEAVGCVLSRDVTAPFDLPVTDSAACDGYALRTVDVREARKDHPVELSVVDQIRAGDINPVTLLPGHAAKISSGAPLPGGADAVLAPEYTDQGLARVQIKSAPRAGENIRVRAEDVATGDPLVKAGTRLASRHVAMLAGAGLARVWVHPRPRVVVISIGDELVEPGDTPRPGQVFDANGHALATAAADLGTDVFRVGAVSDSRAELRSMIEDQLVRADLIVTTGGLSGSEVDTVPEVLAPLGVVEFDQVAMWPGRVHGVGHVGGIPIFCLPGDPVAAQVSFAVFVHPAIRAMAGYEMKYRPTLRANVDRGWYSPRGRREFVRVTIDGSPSQGYNATVQGGPHQLLVSALGRSNALAVVPEAVTHVQAGDELVCILLDD